jgi:hypothetical protein
LYAYLVQHCQIMRKISLFLLLLFKISTLHSQPFTFKSVGLAKAFQLTIYFGTNGKGAFVQYDGKTGILPLRLKNFSVALCQSLKIDKVKYRSSQTDHATGQPKCTTYVWDEIVNGVVNGSYGLTTGPQQVTDIWYLRKKDGKRFKLELVNKTEKYDGNDKYLLHGNLLSFNHFGNDMLTISYRDGTKKMVGLPEIDNPDHARQSVIEDYNFDGYHDIAFTVPDAGMGVYRIFSIWLFNPKSKHFEALPEPNYSKSNCSMLSDVTVDSKKKLLYSSCRGGAKWWSDAYRFSPTGKLVWVSAKNLDKD